MTKPFNPRDHIRPIPGAPDGEVQLSLPAMLLITAGFLDDEDNSPATISKAKGVIEDFVALMRSNHYPQAEYLETMLLCGPRDARRLLPALDKAVNAVGQHTVAAMIERRMQEG
ncbi:hypothetical protein [Chromobacterium sp. IIBBL 290-4]|uniref:hypothetical protein n=1 Tax=Chromobacterium sp. IIBBL 290-4 TaxID=2953890 RepID=UPI0020B6F8CA|nr:hypothetical protein [Chromobacterium sp. IIBBL 290-4]UTH72504.1 hypothetical protein NKT35_13185 [Chromobacterium sp. IIBBL 290-4]